MSEGYKLPEEIVALSRAKTWDRARLEWRIELIHWEGNPETCLCGQVQINELFHLRNIENGNTALDGNVYVKKVVGLPSDKIFDAVKRVAKNRERALNIQAFEHAFARGWLALNSSRGSPRACIIERWLAAAAAGAPPKNST